MADIAWVSFGHVGGPMAGNLVLAGRTVKGFHFCSEALKAAREQGVHSIASIRESVAGADAAFTMVPKGQCSISRSLRRFAMRRLQTGAVVLDRPTFEPVVSS